MKAQLPIFPPCSWTGRNVALSSEISLVQISTSSLLPTPGSQQFLWSHGLQGGLHSRKALMLLCLNVVNSVFDKRDSIYPKYAFLQIVEVAFGIHFNVLRRSIDSC